MIFDFDNFSVLVEMICEETATAYELPEILSVFRCFFEVYEKERGAVHPFVGEAKIRDMIQKMPYVETDPGADPMYIEPETYPALIRAYFSTKYRNCNYHIFHFFSGRIRSIKLYEIM